MVTLALSLFFYFLLMPLVLFLGRFHIPRALAAGAVVALVLMVLSYGVLYSIAPAAQWMEDIPELVPSMREKLLPLSEPISKIEQAASEVENITKPDGDAQAEVTVSDDRLVDGILASLRYTLVSTGVIVFLTFFFLTFGERLQQKIARLGRGFAQQRRLVRIARDIQTDISRFLGVISAINPCLGAIASFVFWFLGVPNFLTAQPEPRDRSVCCHILGVHVGTCRSAGCGTDTREYENRVLPPAFRPPASLFRR
jgi:predicted PurR-regulated permease PerM